MTEANKTPYHDAHDILPDEECIMCGEKHYSYAMELAAEIGYVPVNTQKIIGQLTAAQWHVFKYDEQLANDIRDVRHYVQERTPDLIDWKPICIKLDELIKKDKEASLLKYAEAKGWLNSLIGERNVAEDRMPRLKQLHAEFLSEKNVGGGCSSCRLRRLTRKYKEILGREFSG